MSNNKELDPPISWIDAKDSAVSEYDTVLQYSAVNTFPRTILNLDGLEHELLSLTCWGTETSATLF